MTRFILILALGLAGWLLYKLYLKQLLNQGRQGKIKLALIIVGFALVILALTGRASIVFAFIGAAMTQIMRLMPLLIRFFPMLQQLHGQRKVFSDRTDQQSEVRSVLLSMTLDHDSGHIDGKVTDGQFAGRGLRELSPAELQQLHAECIRLDPEGARLLEAFVARVHGDTAWQQQNDPGSAPRAEAARPTASEAADILAIAPDATKEEILTAHRKLMSRVHPDKGGSNYLAAKINAAKEVMLERLDQA